MKILFYVMGIIFSITSINKGLAQGPPITADKPILLSSQTKEIKTLSEFRKTESGNFLSIPLMVHYLPTSNSLVGVHVPYVHYAFKDAALGSGSTLGDIAILGKYQFLRKDQMGKTFRMVAKTLQTLPTGKALGIDGISLKEYQSYVGVVAGYETIKYGISSEVGYNLVPADNRDEFRYKLGFGLPLLKPGYPVDQLNLYFEYQNSWFTQRDEFMMLFAQGIQYAKGRVTVEASVQFPLVQQLTISPERDFSLFFGSRIIF